VAVHRRPGFYKVLHARLRAIGAGADAMEALEITEMWVRGEIGRREAVRRPKRAGKGERRS